MRASVVVLTLAVQVVTVAVLFAFSGKDSEAYPMEAGYVLRNQDLHLVYFEGVPAQMAYEKIDSPEKISKNQEETPVIFKRSKNIRCEKREKESAPVFRCAVDLRRI